MGDCIGEFVCSDVGPLTGVAVGALVSNAVRYALGLNVGPCIGELTCCDVGLLMGVVIGVLVSSAVRDALGISRTHASLVGDNVRVMVDNLVGASVCDSFGDSVGDVVGASIGGNVGVTKMLLTSASVGPTVTKTVGDEVETDVGTGDDSTDVGERVVSGAGTTVGGEVG